VQEPGRQVIGRAERRDAARARDRERRDDEEPREQDCELHEVDPR
jgi:hypothetical protein